MEAIDPGFEWGAIGAIGATIMAIRLTTLPGPSEQQQGQQLMLSFWAWGNDEREVMTNLDRTFHNLTVALRQVSDEICSSSPANGWDVHPSKEEPDTDPHKNCDQ